MPTNRLVAAREVATYAGVLLDGLYEAGGQDLVLEVREQLRVISRHLRINKDFSDVLADTSYTPAQHCAIVKNTFTELGLNPVLVDVLGVMAQRKDLRLISRVSASFEEQLEKKLDVTVIDVVTAVALDDNLRKQISEKAANEFGTKVVLNEQVDRSILGGVVINVKSRRIDASVASQLENARKILKQSTDGGESS